MERKKQVIKEKHFSGSEYVHIFSKSGCENNA